MAFRLAGAIAPALFSLALATSGAAGAMERPATEAAMAEAIRTAIEARDLAALSELVFWKDAGKIKKRIVAIHLNHSLGRAVKSVEVSPIGAHALDGVLRTGTLAPNMEVTHKVTVTFDEPSRVASGEAPSSVFLIGKRNEEFRIALVNRVMEDDDDD